MLFFKGQFVLSMYPLGLITTILFITEWTSGQNGPPPLPLKFHEDHRLIQWCVNGIDEPEFDQYPFSEFRQFLQRKYYEHYKANVRFKYEIDMWPIQNKEASIGSGGILYQRAHFVFKAKIRRKFEHDVFTAYNDTNIEGLIVQANYAPLGVGLPTGEFVHPSHFNCDDCTKPIGVPVGCRKRTYLHPVHPTILLFHHKMRIPVQEGRRRQQRCLDNLIPNQCLVTGLKDPDPVAGADGASPVPVIALSWPKLKMGQPLPHHLQTCSTDSDCSSQFSGWYKEKCCPEEDDTEAATPAPGVTGGPAAEEKKCKNVWEAPAADNGTEEGGAPTYPAFHPHCPEFANLKADPAKQTYPTFECKPYVVNLCRPAPQPDAAIVPIPWIKEDDLSTGLCPEAKPGAAATTFDRYKTEDQCCVDVIKKDADKKCPPAPATPGNPPPGPMFPSAPPPTKVCDTECKSADPAAVPLKCQSMTTIPHFPEVDGVTMPDKGPPFEAVTAEEPDTTDCTTLGNEPNFGKTSEVHGNFVWYFQPCYYTARIRFLLLVVHSFQRGIYSIVESDDYYDLKSAYQNSPSGTVNPSIPSPLFTGFPHECEKSGNTDSLYSKTFQEEPFDYSRSYDACIQEIGGNKTQVCHGVPKFTPDDGKRGGRKPGGKPKPKPTSPSSNVAFPKCPDVIPPNTLPAKCEEACPTLPVTTMASSTTERVGFIKRSAHGGINIVTNFCIMPICIFIARFYKETFNLQSYKGQKQWYWMHMLGAGGSTILMYMGYFSRKYVELNEHVVLGDIYIICLGISYATAWIRHKKKLISMIVEVAHVGCGYVCFLLALRCVGNATYPTQSDGKAVTLVVYVASASLIVFYVGMTIHICSLDQKFGMKPRRLHFPTVEARFDDLPVPGRNVRKAFLIVLLCVNLPLTLATLVL